MYHAPAFFRCASFLHRLPGARPFRGGLSGWLRGMEGGSASFRSGMEGRGDLRVRKRYARTRIRRARVREIYVLFSFLKVGNLIIFGIDGRRVLTYN